MESLESKIFACENCIQFVEQIRLSYANSLQTYLQPEPLNLADDKHFTWMCQHFVDELCRLAEGIVRSKEEARDIVFDFFEIILRKLHVKRDVMIRW